MLPQLPVTTAGLLHQVAACDQTLSLISVRMEPPAKRGSNPARTTSLLQAASHTPQQPPVGHWETGGSLEAAQHPEPRTGIRVLQEGSTTALREWINFVITSHTERT